VTTVVAVHVACAEVDLVLCAEGSLDIASILPGVLTGIREEDVLSCQLTSPVVLVSCVSLGFNFDAENLVAEVSPVVEREHGSSLAVESVGSLEEAELIAVLPRPLTHAVVHVNLGVLHVLHTVSAVFSTEGVLAVIGDCLHLSLHVLARVTVDQIAKNGALAVLDGTDVVISEVVEEGKVTVDDVGGIDSEN